ncbi:hypothetical protein DPEC_G00220140 [Dallia pectoralis]|uniref:Uncharacterized protein n=1 Tax=Dallia pectoralis TaxID=75939 RepID=A0ACC2G3M2_DALPE|nr:hypothetical protein DPEC_G00220140 [Dallia pectoralis]
MQCLFPLFGGCLHNRLRSGTDEPAYCPGPHGQQSCPPVSKFVHNKWDEMWDSRILQKHPDTYIHGCPVAHNNAKAAGEVFLKVS